MPAHNFMAEDLLGAIRAILIFSLFLLIPGYVLAWAMAAFDFRRRTLAFQLALAIALSASVCPIVTYLIGRYLSMSGVWALYSLLVAAFAGIVLVERRALPAKIRALVRENSVFAALLAVWLVIAVLSLIDLQAGGKLYYSASTIDYSVRTEFVHSISTTGIPPRNPFFAASHDAPLRYHYFWLLVCSLVDQVGGVGVTARQALIGGTFWTGVCLIALAAIYLRLFLARATAFRGRLLTAIALMTITGLDLIPALFFLMLYALKMVPFALPSVEWWNEHVDWFVYTAIWAPHAAIATVACFTGFLFLWYSAERRGYAILAALALASAVGDSIYVAFSFAVFLSLWTVIQACRKSYRETIMLCCTGAATAFLLLPYLHDLIGPGAGGPLFTFTVRDFSFAALVNTGGLPAMWRRLLVNLPLVPLNYILEFGLFFLVARFKWQQHRASGEPLSQRDLALGLMVATSTMVCTFLRSSVIGCNDLGWRGFLVAEFVLLLWAVDLFRDRVHLTFLNPAQKQLLTVCFVIGACGTALDLALVRLYPVLADAGVFPPIEWMAKDRDFGYRTFAARQAFAWLRTATNETAAVQSNPNVTPHDVLGLIYSERPTAAGDASCHTIFGGDPKECTPVVSRIMGAFAENGGASDLRGVCDSLPVNAVVARDTDAVWQNRKSWVWSERPAYSNAYFRVFPCTSEGTPFARR